MIQCAEAVARGGVGVDIRLLFMSEVSIDGRGLMQRMAWFEGHLLMYLYEPIHMDRK